MESVNFEEPTTEELLKKYGLSGEDDPRFPNFTNATRDDYLEYGTNEYFDAIEFCVENKLWPIGRLVDMTLDNPDNPIYAILLTRNGGPVKDDYYYVYDILSRHPDYGFVIDGDIEGDDTYAEFTFKSY